MALFGVLKATLSLSLTHMKVKHSPYDCNIINGSPAYLTVIHLYFIHFILFISANIALNKTTSMSSTYSGSSDSSKAVDGLKTNFSYSGGQCAISANNHKTAEWRVNLGDMYSIYNITIYTRTENLAWSKYLTQYFRWWYACFKRSF